MMRVVFLSFLALFLSGCMAYYQGPNHRDIDNDAFVYSKMTIQELETGDFENKYELTMYSEYRYLDGKPQESPSGRDFKLIKLHSPTATNSGVQTESSVSDYKQVEAFRFKGHFDFEYKTCTLRLNNKHKIKWLNKKKDNEFVTLVGRIHKKDPIRHTITMAYTVKESTIPELLGQVFYGRALVCGFNEPSNDS